MSNILLLTKLFYKSSYRSSKKNGKFTMLFTIAIFVLGGLGFFKFISQGVNMVYPLLKNIGSEDLIITMPLRAISVFIFIISTVSIISYFYSGDDMNLILPLPVKPYEIITAKFVTAITMQYVIAIIILLPLIWSFGQLEGLGAIYYISGFIVLITFPLLPIILNLFLIMILMSFSIFAKSKDMFKNIILGLVMIGSYSVRFIGNGFSTKIANADNLKNIAATEKNWIFTKITNVFYTINFQADSLLHSGTTKGYIGIIVALILTIITYLALSLFAQRFYLQGVVGSGSVFAKRKALTSKGLDKGTKVSSTLKASFIKETRVLFRNSTFAFNCVFQNLIYVVFILVAIWKGSEVFNELGILSNLTMQDSMTTYIIIIVVAMMVLVSALNNISSTAITREGQNAFVMKYLAIDYKTQIIGKALVAVLFNLIYLVVFIIGAILLHINIMVTLLIVILSIVVMVFTSITGVLVDLNNPNLDWDNETRAIKQNMNPFKNLAMNIIIGLFMYILFKMSISPVVTFIIILAVYLILIFVVLQYINKNATKMFNKIR